MYPSAPPDSEQQEDHREQKYTADGRPSTHVVFLQNQPQHTPPYGHPHAYVAPRPHHIHQLSTAAPPVKWSTGLCHCCDDPANCAVTTFCPCITFGQIAEIVDRGSSGCARSGTVFGLMGLTGLAYLYSCGYRSKLRGQYDLDESPCVDCLVHFCCGPCALCQEYRELKNRGYDLGIGWEANMQRQQRGVGAAAPNITPPMTR